MLLYTTVAVSGIHLLFDVLAFKSDITFWNSVDSMEGLSSRSLLLNQLMELIVFLYLLEEEVRPAGRWPPPHPSRAGVALSSCPQSPPLHARSSL